MEIAEAVCKRDWHNMRLYLFFNVRKFRTPYAMTFISPLKGHHRGETVLRDFKQPPLLER